MSPATSLSDVIFVPFALQHVELMHLRCLEELNIEIFGWLFDNIVDLLISAGWLTGFTQMFGRIHFDLLFFPIKFSRK